jgi:hypothetical protein
LKDVDLYKVGHHGSLNATPKDLWGLFTRKRTDSGSSAVMKTVVSTLAAKHGHAEDGTEVPRTKLVAELMKFSDYYTTQAMESSRDISHNIQIL